MEILGLRWNDTFFSNLFHFKDETDRYGFNVGRRDEKLPVSRPSQLTPSITVLK